MRTDPNRRKHAPADAHPDEQREGTLHARRSAKDEAREAEVDDLSLPFCACGRSWSQCDGSRKGCHTRRA
jgi:hypothetical protein